MRWMALGECLALSLPERFLPSYSQDNIPAIEHLDPLGQQIEELIHE